MVLINGTVLREGKDTWFIIKGVSYLVRDLRGDFCWLEPTEDEVTYQDLEGEEDYTIDFIPQELL